MNQNAKQAAEIIQDIEASLFRGDDAGDDAGEPASKAGRLDEISRYRAAAANQQQGATVEAQRYARDVAFLFAVIDEQRQTADAALKGLMQEATRRAYERGRAIAARPTQTFVTTGQLQYATQDEMRKAIEYGAAPRDEEAERNVLAAISFGTGDEPEDDDDDDEDEDTDLYAPPPDHEELGEAGATKDAVEQAIARHMPPEDEPPASCPCDDCNMARRLGLVASHDQVQQFGRVGLENLSAMTRRDSDAHVWEQYGRFHAKMDQIAAMKTAGETARDKHFDEVTRKGRTDAIRDVKGVCCCGEPETAGVQHRRDGPCFVWLPAPPIASADPAPGTLGALENTAKHLGEIMAPYAAMKTAPPIAPAILPPYDDGSGILLGNRVTDDNEADVRPVEPSCACASPTMHEPDCQWAIYRKRQRERA
jgi:hypothetical protein